MALLIDGYNLLHATDIFGAEPGNFHQTRQALLDTLAVMLPPLERKEATIVFDAADAPPGLPSAMHHESISVLYARNYPDADAMIEEIIEGHRSPRSLLVVSSDHRVQRAARRRGASFIDSDRWYVELCQRQVQRRGEGGASIPEKPTGELGQAEIARWVQIFQTEDAEEFSKPNEPKNKDISQKKPPPEDLGENPFPPGYGEDLLEGL